MRDIENLQKELQRANIMFEKTKDEGKKGYKEKEYVRIVNFALDYVKTLPSEAFVQSEYERLEQKLKHLQGGYVRFFKDVNKMTSEAKRKIDIKLGIDKVNAQIDILKFILGE